MDFQYKKKENRKLYEIGNDYDSICYRKSITIPGNEIENGKQWLFCSARTPLFKRFDAKRRRKKAEMVEGRNYEPIKPP